MTAIVLSLLMLLGLFPLTAYAANGPSEENMSYALFYNGEESYPVYREQQAVNDSIGGATYDRSTNTVTITDFNQPELGIATNMMGDDLKLKVVGIYNMRNTVSIRRFFHLSPVVVNVSITFCKKC